MKTRKIFIFIFFFILNLFLTNKIFAENLALSFSKESLGTGEQFYVDIMLDPEGKSVNTISGSLIFPNENISFIRAEDGKSMVNLWVEKPELNASKNTISFAGVMTNGFEGVIDPFNTFKKLPGLIVRLVFETKKSGQVNFSTSSFSLNLSDGLGTEIKIPSINRSINVLDNINTSKYENESFEAPQLDAYITRDPNIYNNKYILIFEARDKETGIKKVMIKEGRRDWKEVKSPYLLKDQSRHSNINLQAINFSGAGISINIDKIPYDWKFITQIAIIIIVVISLSIFIIRKIYKHRINRRR